MNCKPGDLAVIIFSESEAPRIDIGKIVHVVEPWGDGKSWVIESARKGGLLTQWDGRLVRRCAEWDHNLRPIRGMEGEDEILRLAGIPKQLESA